MQVMISRKLTSATFPFTRPFITRAQFFRSSQTNRFTFILVRCCAVEDCDPELLQRRPGAPSDCACPSARDSVCIDAETPFILGEGDSYREVAPATSIYFEIAINEPCNNLVISTNSYRGLFSLSLGATDTPPFDILHGSAFHLANNLGTNQIVLCANPQDGVWFH